MENLVKQAVLEILQNSNFEVHHIGNNKHIEVILSGTIIIIEVRNANIHWGQTTYELANPTSINNLINDIKKVQNFITKTQTHS